MSFRDDVLDLGHLHAGKKKRVCGGGEVRELQLIVLYLKLTKRVELEQKNAEKMQHNHTEWFEGGYGSQLFSRLSVQPVVNSQEHFLLMRVQCNIGSWVKQQFVQGNLGEIVVLG